MSKSVVVVVNVHIQEYVNLGYLNLEFLSDFRALGMKNFLNRNYTEPLCRDFFVAGLQFSLRCRSVRAVRNSDASADTQRFRLAWSFCYGYENAWL